MKVSLSKALGRVKDSLWQIMQLVLASILSYVIARFGFGHPVPLLAVTVAISSLGFARDTRPGRVATTALAMVLGVVLSETALVLFGPGTLQLLLVILLALLSARLISPNPTFALTVAIQAVLVQLLDAPTGGDFARVIDGLIGGLMALAFTALVPRNPIRLARADSRLLFATVKDTLAKLREVLLTADKATADLALENIRQTQPLVDNWKSSLESAAAIAKLSPFYRWAQKEIADQRVVFKGLDLATRNLRVITRRIDYALQDNRPRPELAAVISKALIAVDLLEQSLDDFSLRAKAQKYLLKLIKQLDPQSIAGAGLSDQVIFMQLRPMIVDLAVAAGIESELALKQLPHVD
ncbi:MAG: hypothetical protein RLZ99_334 [Actinomycetota bacterium]